LGTPSKRIDCLGSRIAAVARHMSFSQITCFQPLAISSAPLNPSASDSASFSPTSCVHYKLINIYLFTY